uniref:Uncharacterized protein n=1 Tax=Streptomyces sp. NBC_01401 TaxID=2903854 RepID=A0AAU3GN91_9ACTN
MITTELVWFKSSGSSFVPYAAQVGSPARRPRWDVGEIPVGEARV